MLFDIVIIICFYTVTKANLELETEFANEEEVNFLVILIYS